MPELSPDALSRRIVCPRCNHLGQAPLANGTFDDAANHIVTFHCPDCRAVYPLCTECGYYVPNPPDCLKCPELAADREARAVAAEEEAARQAAAAEAQKSEDERIAALKVEWDSYHEEWMQGHPRPCHVHFKLSLSEIMALNGGVAVLSFAPVYKDLEGYAYGWIDGRGAVVVLDDATFHDTITPEKSVTIGPSMVPALVTDEGETVTFGVTNVGKNSVVTGNLLQDGSLEGGDGTMYGLQKPADVPPPPADVVQSIVNPVLCSATKRDGQPCTAKAGPSGLCMSHGKSAETAASEPKAVTNSPQAVTNAPQAATGLPKEDTL